MLTAAQFDQLVNPIMALFAAYEQTVINDIARRLANLDYASAAWQVQRLSESGKLYKDILKELSKLTGKSEKQLKQIFRQAGVKTMRFDDAIYRRAGLSPLPLNLSPAMAQVLAAGLRKTNGLINNLVMSTAGEANAAFIAASDIAYLQVSTGAMSYDQAIKEAVKKLAKDGIFTVDYPSGHKDHLDVAMRRAVLTGVGQTAAQLQLTRMDEMGVEHIAVSAHIGARNTGEGYENHESWQGKIYQRNGGEKYPNFEQATGYGTGAGLAGWNCRHSFYPFFEGISENAYDDETLKEYAAETVKYSGKEISVYEASQIQRAMERKIRYWKRQAGALEAAGLDATMERFKVKQWQARMRDFIKQTDLNRQSVRERVITA